MKKNFRILLIILIAVFLLPNFCFAQEIQEGVDLVAESSGIPVGDTMDIRVLIGRIIQVALGFIGIIGISFVIYAGFLWMTSGGDPTKIGKAKKLLIQAVIGLTIILSSYFIVNYVINTLQDKILGINSDDSNISTGLGGNGLYGSSLGNGVLHDHYPGKSQTNVSRNTKIMVTFKVPLDKDSLIENGQLKTGAVSIFAACDNQIAETNNELKECEKEASKVSGQASLTEDKKTIIITPNEYLGSSTENFIYYVHLTSNIKKDGGKSSVFQNYKDYAWWFETGTLIDVTPPQISTVKPLNDEENVVLNKIIQINFNEAIIPPKQVHPAETGGKEILVFYLEGEQEKYIAGEFAVGLNQYKTVNFIPTNKCSGVEQNSCGEPVYCLPASKEIFVKIKAAKLLDDGPMAEFPYTGIVDSASNSFDGNKDGVANGEGVDNYQMNFKTGNSLDLVPPKVVSIFPNLGEQNVAVDKAVEISFSENIDVSSVNSDNLYIESDKWKKSYWFTTLDKTIFINHDNFNKSLEGEVVISYSPVITSAIRDDAQNCFNPAIGPACSDINFGQSCCDGVVVDGACE